MLHSVCSFLVRVIKSMPTGCALPDPLPWAALAPSLAAAEDRLARLDDGAEGPSMRKSTVAYWTQC
jgi:hypothetical protein